MVCPDSAIEIKISVSGFYEPVIDDEVCTDCGVCCEVCYKHSEIEQSDVYEKSDVYAVTNNYIDQLSEVSTVGVASRLADVCFEEGWNVCGAVYDYDSHHCKHIVAKNNSDLAAFKRSKYIQSSVADSYKELLSSDKQTIVFGLPCQIYGLKKAVEYLGQSERFVFVDFFCAGVPTLFLWKSYLSYLKRKHGIEKISNINFRDKANGWCQYSMVVIDEKGNVYRNSLFNDIYFAFFLKKICLDESCYDCIFRKSAAASDIRLGDFWGKKYKGWDEGVQLMTIFSEPAQKLWEKVKPYFTYQRCEPKDVYESQEKAAMKMPKKPDYYDDLIHALSKEKTLEKVFVDYGVNKIKMGGE